MRKKYIMVIDVETANSMDDPLVYDIGYAIGDLHGNIVESGSYLISEIFRYRPELMNSAYYANKIPAYWQDLKDNKHCLTNLYNARQAILRGMKKYNVKEVYAYNASFDLRALNTTYRYLTKSKWRWFFPYGTTVKCIWSMACDTIFQHKTFRKLALREKWFSNSGKFFLSNAETAFRYMSGNYEFDEEHTGLEDVKIEYQILLYVRRQKKKMNQKINRLCFMKMRIPKTA